MSVTVSENIVSHPLGVARDRPFTALRWPIEDQVTVIMFYFP